MNNKKKVLFYLLIIFLVVNRMVAIANMTCFFDNVDKVTLFITSTIARGIPPVRSLFQIEMGGGGAFMYSIIAVPFIFLLGKSYFTLRLASIVFLIVTYILTFKFCNKYFNFKTALFAALLFVMTPIILTNYSIVANGRHFHLNLFFISSIYLFAKIKEEEKTLYYLLFGIVCGTALYFYAGFLITIAIFGLFFIFNIDFKKPFFLYKYFIVLGCIIFAAHFLSFEKSWYSAIGNFIFDNPGKTLYIHGDIFSVTMRFIDIACNSLPLIFKSTGFSGYYLLVTALSLSSFPDVMSLVLFRLIFMVTLISLCWSYRRHIIKIICNIFYSKRKHTVLVRDYIVCFLLAHLIIYILFCSLNGENLDRDYYYMPLFLNIILLIAIFLDTIWRRNKYFSICGLIFALMPGIVFQSASFAHFSLSDFYLHFIYFYEDHTCNELFMSKSPEMLKRMGNVFDVRTLHTIGGESIRFGDIQEVQDCQRTFEYICDGDINKLKRIYQGYIKNMYFYFNRDMRATILRIDHIEDAFQNYCYKGLGEGVLYQRFHPHLNEFRPDITRDKKIIERSYALIDDRYKRSFTQGLGIGLAKNFAVAYSPYITERGFYDDTILRDYLNVIDQKYKKDFFAGFTHEDIWDAF